MPRAAGILFTHGGRVLLMKRAAHAKDAPGVWGLPGGHIEAGEDAEMAARRELHEETGHRYTGPLHSLYTTHDGFQCFGAALSAPFDAKINHEHTAVQWAPLDKLPAKLHPSFSEIPAMPLVKGKSDADRSKSIATEIRAGKDPKQAAAIGYAIQREADGKDAKHAMDAGSRKLALDSIRQTAEHCMSPTAPKKPKESQ